MNHHYNNCDIAFDLLPLYLDGKTGQESNAFMERHLSECKECRKNYELMKTTAMGWEPEQPKVPRERKKAYRRLMAKIYRLWILFGIIYIAMIFFVAWMMLGILQWDIG